MTLFWSYHSNFIDSRHALVSRMFLSEIPERCKTPSFFEYFMRPKVKTEHAAKIKKTHKEKKKVSPSSKERESAREKLRERERERETDLPLRPRFESF